MKCSRVLRLLPLMAGGDLPPRKAARIGTHLDVCLACRDQAHMYRYSLDKAREWLGSQETVWNESEWTMSIRRAVRYRRRDRTPLAPWPFKIGWALAGMTTAAALLILFVVHPAIVRAPVQKTSVVETEAVRPEILSLSLVSQETGLKINWFFLKDLKLEVLE